MTPTIMRIAHTKNYNNALDSYPWQWSTTTHLGALAKLKNQDGRSHATQTRTPHEQGAASLSALR
jgi:hypothetical protein